MKECKSEIMQGLKEERFYIVYQGKWSVESEKVESYEALLYLAREKCIKRKTFM